MAPDAGSASAPVPPTDPALLALARVAADEVRDGMIVGLGTGSTAEALVHELGRRVADGLRFTGVPTSERTARLVRSLGIPVRGLDDVLAAGDAIAVGIDGADEIDAELNATKGRGGALLFEKLVAISCRRFVLIASDAKLVDRLGTRMPVPVEVVALGWQGTRDRLAALGYGPTLRAAGPEGAGDPYLTDSRNLILDCVTGPIEEPVWVAEQIKATTGVVDHGLFLGLADAAYVASPAGEVRRLDGAVVQ